MKKPRRPAWLIAALAVSFSAGLAQAAADCGPTAYDCALQHVARREFMQAIRLLEVQLAATPRDLKALNLVGIALTGAGRKADANDRFRTALSIDPSFNPARKNLAINEFDAGRSASAKSHLESVLKLAPADEIANIYLAEILFQSKETSAALKHYDKAGDRISQSPAWLLHYARCQLDAGRTEDAVTILERLPERDADGHFEAGVALGRAGAHAPAARFFARARAGYKDPYVAGYNQTLMLIEAGDHAEAARVAEEILSQGTRPAELYNLAARAYAGVGRIQEAYDALRNAARIEPKAVENYIDLAMLCMEHENFDLGMEIVDVGLARQPESWMLHVQRGVLWAMKSQFGQAEKEFDAARGLAPNQPVPYAALAMVWMQSGQTGKAVDVLRGETRRGNGGHVIPYIFAVSLLRSGVDPEQPAGLEAALALGAAIRAKPDFTPARAELGRLLLKRGDLDGAIGELEKAAALDPGRAATLYALAQAYRKKGDRQKASDLLARVSKLNERERGDDPDAELKRVVVRLVREGAQTGAGQPVER